MAVQVSMNIRVSCLRFIRSLCSHVTSLTGHLSATYLVDLYSRLIGQLRQQHRSLTNDDVVRCGGGRSNDAVPSNELLMMELTLATVVSVLDVDKFNSCLQQLLTDMV